MLFVSFHFTHFVELSETSLCETNRYVELHSPSSFTAYSAIYYIIYNDSLLPITWWEIHSC